MKKHFIISFILLLAFNYIIKAQTNLVPNPSFEDTIANPSGGLIDDANGWINCNLSPDYYNAGFNSDGLGFGVPNCYYTGYQNAFDGNAFAGLGITAVPEQPAEFIGVQLTQPLVIGTKYFVSAYISRADDYPCASNNFGFKFFNSLYFLTSFNPPPIDNYAHVNSSALITDSLNWQLIGGSFIADSAYRYLVIGNFYNLSQTNTLNCFSNPDASYYYLDEVCVSSDSLTCQIPTAIQQLSKRKNEVYVYPNPANGEIYLKNLPHSAEAYTLFNSLGVNCANGRFNPNQNIIDIHSLLNGVYLLSIDQRYFFKVLINNH